MRLIVTCMRLSLGCPRNTLLLLLSSMVKRRLQRRDPSVNATRALRAEGDLISFHGADNWFMDETRTERLSSDGAGVLNKVNHRLAANPLGGRQLFPRAWNCLACKGSSVFGALQSENSIVLHYLVKGIFNNRCMVRIPQSPFSTSVHADPTIQHGDYIQNCLRTLYYLVACFIESQHQADNLACNSNSQRKIKTTVVGCCGSLIEYSCYRSNAFVTAVELKKQCDTADRIRRLTLAEDYNDRCMCNAETQRCEKREPIAMSLQRAEALYNFLHRCEGNRLDMVRY
ncbi:uncharacterized protein BDR25DRAFT_355679 [Lindgomyces ingoldianus]|uniref:Uncharacterized protein n=1 Tax=Lindgomyces ingoldianus TaxID=673940 RepID=A0ACB6QSY1_9PLEO|nr:uncharacterized protein BDR25DRAFT_355679 [Lindgomyces ingoldianus]KAF2469952.1 hypothetical protein BDR25DRAFT_355679 [Lindgomyces ingoldianus]